MKAITIRQPWASAIVAGIKTIEVRTWSTRHRGPLAIHAAATVDTDYWPAEDEFELPTSAVIGVCDLVECRPLTEKDRKEACFNEGAVEGLWAWVLANPRPIGPIPARGKPGLWDWEPQEMA